LEVTHIYLSLSKAQKESCAVDIPIIVIQTIKSLGTDTDVILHGLKLLETLAVEHISSFIPELNAIFQKLQVIHLTLF
jgi:hypothetical protein